MTGTLCSTRLVLSLLIVLLGLAGQALSQDVPLIPMRDFFRNPEKTGYTISPEGRHIAFLKPWESRLNVYVSEVGSEEEVRVTSSSARDIFRYLWAGEERIAYLQDRAGNENFHLFVANIDGTGERELTPFPDVKVTIVDELEDVDDEMLIGMNRRNPEIFDVYRINLRTGALEMIAENPGNIASWVTDNEGRLRAAIAQVELTDILLYRETEAQEFREIFRHDFRSSLDPLFFTFDDRNLYVLSDIGRETRAVYEFDPRKAEMVRTVFSHPEVDVAGLLRSKEREVITGAVYVTDKRHYNFFDPLRRELQEFLDARFPGMRADVADMSRDESKVLVHVAGDRTRGAYYYCDRTKGELRKLSEISPWLDPDLLAPMRPVTYTARDSVSIQAYLTLPPGKEPKNLPAIILPHGGPWVRDVWGFDAEVQFLANRGMAVLQPNYRGSTGFGRPFWVMSFQEWGLDMQDDLTDGVHWLIDQGIADPERVGIYGASYGGYATLAGLAFTPEVYACGVDYVGVSNLFTLLENIPPYWELGRDRLYVMIGHPVKDRELLRAVSPVFHANRIQAPLLVAQGANDPRVKKIESDQIVREVRRHGVHVEYMVKENEGHGFVREENRFDFYRAMETFLARHLGTRKEGTTYPDQSAGAEKRVN